MPTRDLFRRAILDSYSLRARLAPTLLVFFPVLAVAFVLLYRNLTMARGLVVLFFSCGGAILLAQVGRGLGKRKEGWLFAEWGGAPTTVLLTHLDAARPVQVEAYHQQLEELFPDLKLPTVAEELQNSEQADQVYDIAVERLRERTRDRSRFPLVFEENCNYGFRRNLWGLRPYGLALSVLATVSIGGILVARIVSDPQQVAAGEWISLGLASLWSLWWWKLVTPQWVRVVAEAYALRLLGTLEVLSNMEHAHLIARANAKVEAGINGTNLDQLPD